MKALSLYQDHESFIHKVDAITKMCYIVVAILVPMIISDIRMGLLWVLISASVLMVGKVAKKVIPLIGLSGIILITTILIQSFFYQNNKTVLFQIGKFGFYQEGFWFAMGICVRVINVLCAFSILVLTTKPSDLVESLVRRGLSPRLGYVLLSVLQIIPQMVATMDTITDAQRARGMETEGNLIVRFKAFLPLIGPVVMNALTSTRERSLALEVRGFNAKVPKTFLNVEEKGAHNRRIQLLLACILLMTLVWRIIG